MASRQLNSISTRTLTRLKLSTRCSLGESPIPVANQVSPRSHLLLRGGLKPKGSKVAAFLAWVCNRPRYWDAGVAPPVRGAGVTHHLPGLPLDEGWHGFNMVHKWLCLCSGELGLVDMRCIQILVSRQSLFPRSLPYHLSTAAFFQRRFSPSVVFLIWPAHSLIVSSKYFHCPFVSLLILRGHQLVPSFASTLRSAGTLSLAEKPIAAPHMS